METQKIKKSIEIGAVKDNVWKVITNDGYTKQWFAEFGEGIQAETDWTVGGKAKFTDKNGDGIVGKVVTNKPNETLSIEYEGVVDKGREDYESDGAKGVKGTQETYVLSGENGVTQLSIECDMAAEYFEMMSAAWDRALEKIKTLSETKA